MEAAASQPPTPCLLCIPAHKTPVSLRRVLSPSLYLSCFSFFLHYVLIVGFIAVCCHVQLILFLLLSSFFQLPMHSIIHLCLWLSLSLPLFLSSFLCFFLPIFFSNCFLFLKQDHGPEDLGTTLRRPEQTGGSEAPGEDQGPPKPQRGPAPPLQPKKKDGPQHKQAKKTGLCTGI